MKSSKPIIEDVEDEPVPLWIFPAFRVGEETPLGKNNVQRCYHCGREEHIVRECPNWIKHHSVWKHKEHMARKMARQDEDMNK